MAAPISAPGTYVLSGDLYLANDIDVSGGCALTFTAPGVRLNLNGKTIRNTAPHPIDVSIGIKGLGANNLAIWGGSITGFRHGVDSITPWTRIERVDLSSNLYIGANLTGHTSRVLCCTIKNIGGVSNETYAIAVNIAGSDSFVDGNVIEEIYMQTLANPSISGEGCPIVVNSSAANVQVIRNHIKNSIATLRSIGIFTGSGGAHLVADNSITNFRTGIFGGRQPTGPLTATDNVIWLKSPLAGSRAHYGDYGSVTGEAIIGYATAFDGVIPQSGNVIIP